MSGLTKAECREIGLCEVCGQKACEVGVYRGAEAEYPLDMMCMGCFRKEFEKRKSGGEVTLGYDLR